MKENKEESILLGILPEESDCGFTSLKNKIKKSKYFKHASFERVIDNPDCNLAYLLKYKKDRIDVEFQVEYYTQPFRHNFHFVNKNITSEEKEKAEKSNHFIVVKTKFKYKPVFDFLEQFKVLVTLVPNVIVIYDISAFQIFSGDMGRSIYEDNIELSLNCLYSIHSVYKNDQIWFHTHGLSRCGIPEIEMIGLLKKDYEKALMYFDTLIFVLLDSGLPEEGEVISPIDEVKIVFLPWKKAYKYMEEIEVGGEDERDNYHSKGNLVLLVPNKFTLFKKDYKLPKNIVSRISDEPIYNISTKQSQRIEKVAQVKFRKFIKYFEKHKDDKEWDFFVKLGFLVDNHKDKNDKEHLWFEVLDINKENIEGKLLNDSIMIQRFEKENVYTNTKNILSDWEIVSPHGKFKPDNIFDLLRKENLGEEDVIFD